MVKAVILISVLVLGSTWTFQGVPAEEVEGTEAPAAAAAADDESLSEGVCEEELEIGPCKMEIPRFFYNSTSMSCEPFTYGGCKGNHNNFKNEKECIVKCSFQEACTATPGLGGDGVPCAPMATSYSYNSSTKSCHISFYGMCSGSQNRYKTEKSCLEKCHPDEFCKAAPAAGPCRAAIPRYFYNSTSQSCELFAYGGCHGNQNNFKTKELCLEECHHEHED